MASGVQSFIETFRHIYDTAMRNLQDDKWLNLYFLYGIEQISVTRIRTIQGNDAILMVDGIDPYGNRCTLLTPVASLSLLMKLEEKEGNKDHERVTIGF